MFAWWDVAGSGAQRLEIYMGAVRLTWILNHGTAGSTRGLICGWSGRRSGSGRRQNVVEVLMMQSGEGIRKIYVRPDWVETGLRHALRGQADGQALRQSGSSALLFQVGSQEILCGCLCECVCEDEAQRSSGVATRMRRRRCVKRYATAKACATLIPLGGSWWEKATELSKA